MSEPEASAVPVAALSYEADAATGASAPTLGFVGLRLLGIYFMLQITGLASLVWLFSGNVSLPKMTAVQLAIQVAGYVLPLVLQVVLGFLMFRHAEKWSSRWFNRYGARELPVTRGDVTVLLVGGIGLLLMVWSLPQLVSAAIVVTLDFSLNDLYTRVHGTGLIESCARFGLGLCMFLFALKLGGLWSRFIKRP